MSRDQKNTSDKEQGINKVSASKSVPVMREQIKNIYNKITDRKKVRLEKKVHTESVNIDLPVIEEELHVERVPVNQYVSAAPPAVRYEGNTMIVSVLKEVVEKRLVLVEELHVTKKRTRKRKTEEAELKNEEVIVQRYDVDPNEENNEEEQRD